MTMQLLKVCLYGNKDERRDVDFLLGKVNIITGKSKTGKSSILEIVEYCLGASECTVAEGLIKQTVDWYSVLLQFSDVQVFIARAAPLPGQKASAACHMLIDQEVVIPEYEDIGNTTNISSALDYLTTKIGIPEFKTEVPAHQTRSAISIKFKHSRYYLFQSQDEVAARKTLFHRQAEQHIPQTIKDTLPYFLGAAEDDRLSDIETLRSLKRDRSRITKGIRELESLKGEGFKKGAQLLAEARSVGLFEGTLLLKDSQIIESLRMISRWEPSNDEGQIVEGDSLYDLDVIYRSRIEQKRLVKSRLQATENYSGTLEGFNHELEEQELRLRSVGLYKGIGTSEVCTVCESSHSGESSLDSVMKTSILQLNERLNNIHRTKPRVQSYIIELKKKEEGLAAELEQLRLSMTALREKESELLTKTELDTKRAKVAGRASLYLDSIDWNIDTSRSEARITELDQQIESLELKLDPESLKERVEAQLSLISEDMTKWSRELELEHSENPIRLDINKLTVVAETSFGRTPLYKMGSGENWVGYHLITYIALAKWFIQQGRPVGRFIFFDQPSQVYFPADVVQSGNLEEIEKDEDRIAVRELFYWLVRVVGELSPELQVIITDHADIDEEWFQSSVIDKKWRGGNALIPAHWYEDMEIEVNSSEE